MERLRKLRRRIHEAIVRRYVPDDDQQELAEALFKWKHSASTSASS
jgi:hypothetical protein